MPSRSSGFVRRCAASGSGRRDDDTDRLADETLGMEPGDVERSVEHERKVHRAVCDCPAGLAAEPTDRGGSEDDGDPRMQGAEPLSTDGTRYVSKVSGALTVTVPVSPAIACHGRRHRCLGNVRQGQNLIGERQERLAGGRERHRAPEAVEQPDAQPSLQGLDLGTDR